MESSLSTRNKPEWKSLNPQFDMEMVFDCRVGMDELNLINGIRSSLGELLSTGPEGVWRINQVKLLHNERDNIMRNLNLLLRKELAYKESELKYRSESYVWFGVNTKPSEEIFREIEAPCLKDWREEMKKLELYSEMNNKEEFNEVKYCPVCSRTLSCPDQIYQHMRTEEHKLSVSRL
ncbi:uncharacterized protein LOC111713413 [Eurytemora carolleeae]|uniref:uncharacterized protein LOC111713413 n=1 Tax=Eurytemora carolleeae TaxID=1294199 RepID=UPI000C76BFF7|nr:uncharacterized protein LOC111713413 [Eurytemora carolleeae]|eukprot:XP_023344029.1 uncharacterized protein LOC111713413 [Eurytemora affinis]